MKKQSGILRRLIALALILCMLTALTAEIFAADIVASGNCGANGSNLTWTLDSEGTLTISGIGKMKDYEYNSFPWYSRKSDIQKLVIEDGVSSVGKYALYSCSNLSSATLGSNITDIGMYSFGFCKNLVDIVIPSNVRTISAYAFQYCSSLTSVTIMDGVKQIGGNAFECCSGLTNINIPNSVTGIYNSAFSGCSSLVNVFIPKSVKNIGLLVFSHCYMLERIAVDAENIKYDSRDDCNAIIETAKNELISG